MRSLTSDSMKQRPKICLLFGGSMIVLILYAGKSLYDKETIDLLRFEILSRTRGRFINDPERHTDRDSKLLMSNNSRITDRVRERNKSQKQRNMFCVKECSVRSFIKRCSTKNFKPYKASSSKALLLIETIQHRTNSFTEIFQKGSWSNHTKSGPGSTLESTVNVRKTLNWVIEFIKKDLGKNVINMLDIPCGDLTWMPSFLHGRTDINYTGMDIVSDIIEAHKQRFRKVEKMAFINQDIVSSPIHFSFDLIFSRYMTQHLTNADTTKVLMHFSESGSNFALIINYPSVSVNTELDLTNSYRHRPQNLEKAPYDLTPPLCQSYEELNGVVDALWRLPFQQVVK